MWGFFVFWDWGHIHCCGCCRWRFRSYSESLFQTPKRNQKALPRRSAPRWGSGFLRYGIDPGAAATVCFAAPTPAVYDFVVRSLRSHTRIDPFTQPAEGAKDQKPNQKPEQKPEQNQKPLTLALSRREREPTVVDVGDTLTWDIELNAQFEKHENRPPLPRERAGVRGESTTNPKPTTRF